MMRKPFIRTMIGAAALASTCLATTGCTSRPQSSTPAHDADEQLMLVGTYTDAGSLVGDYSLATTQVSGMSAALIQTVLKSVSLPDSIAAILQSNLR